MPSFSEGLPVVLIEAQAAGLLCYCSNEISEEVNITGLCQFLPLDEWDQWAEKIVTDKIDRKDTRQAIIDAGYDIESTARMMETFFINAEGQRE